MQGQLCREHHALTPDQSRAGSEVRGHPESRGPARDGAREGGQPGRPLPPHAWAFSAAPAGRRPLGVPGPGSPLHKLPRGACLAPTGKLRRGGSRTLVQGCTPRDWDRKPVFLVAVLATSL